MGGVRGGNESRHEAGPASRLCTELMDLEKKPNTGIIELAREAAEEASRLRNSLEDKEKVLEDKQKALDNKEEELVKLRTNVRSSQGGRLGQNAMFQRSHSVR